MNPEGFQDLRSTTCVVLCFIVTHFGERETKPALSMMEMVPMDRMNSYKAQAHLYGIGHQGEE